MFNHSCNLLHFLLLQIPYTFPQFYFFLISFSTIQRKPEDEVTPDSTQDIKKSRQEGESAEAKMNGVNGNSSEAEVCSRFFFLLAKIKVKK